MNPDVLIDVQQLTRFYGTHRAVHELSFQLHRGEVLGFLGPNGAGKSTTMQMISGNLAPTAGSVSINGVDLLDHPLQAKAALGYLPEQPPLYRELTVDEYLRYCARLNRIPAAQLPTAVATARERCGLADTGRRLIGNLSKGYQQRVGIAQAIIHQPAVVILDEPTVGLDPIQVREIRSLIRELSAEHSVILSSHILTEVQATCDRVLIIHQGEMVLSDSIDGLSRRMQQASLRVGLRFPPTPTELENIAGVKSVDDLTAGRFRLHHAPDENPAEDVAKAAVQHGWGLLELTPEQASLEDIFVQLTRSENLEATA
ncbi:MAG: ATP-binding cassette domain-containing protein [Thiohalomonadaceae bacterium]